MRGDMRGTAVGLVVAAGATWAHQWAGGGSAVAGPTLLLLLVTSLAGGHAVVRRTRTGLPTLLLLAGLAQAAWHVALPSHPMHAGHGTVGGSEHAMLVGHLLVALVTVALAAGADRALVSLARDVLAVPPLPTGVPGVPRGTVVGSAPGDPATREVGPHGARGPPHADPVRARTPSPWSTACPRPSPVPSPVC